MRNEAIDWSSTKAATISFVSFTPSIYNDSMHFVAIYTTNRFVFSVRLADGKQMFRTKKYIRRHTHLCIYIRINDKTWCNLVIFECEGKCFSLPNRLIPWTSQLKFTTFRMLQTSYSTRCRIWFIRDDKRISESSSSDCNILSNVSPSKGTKLVIFMPKFCCCCCCTKYTKLNKRQREG